MKGPSTPSVTWLTQGVRGSSVGGCDVGGEEGVLQEQDGVVEVEVPPAGTGAVLDCDDRIGADNVAEIFPAAL